MFKIQVFWALLLAISSTQALTNRLIAIDIYGQRTITDEFCKSKPSFDGGLELNNDMIDFIAPNAFTLCKSATAVYLYSNNIKSVHKDTFKYNIKLKNIQLPCNRIRYLHDDTFATLTELEELSLDANQLVEFWPQIIANLNSLRILRVAFNYLNELDAEAILQTSLNLVELNIERNKLSCERDEQIKMMLESRNISWPACCGGLGWCTRFHGHEDKPVCGPLVDKQPWDRKEMEINDNGIVLRTKAPVLRQRSYLKCKKFSTCEKEVLPYLSSKRNRCVVFTN